MCICIHPHKIQWDGLPGVGWATFERKTIEEDR